MGNFKLFFCICLVSTVLGGCHTGIENTRTITLTKSEKQILVPTAEEILVSRLSSVPLESWDSGKRFLISDDKGALVFDPSSDLSEHMMGRIISFDGVSARRTPGGVDEAVISFRDGDKLLYYSTGRPMKSALASVSSMDMPLLIDLDLVESAGKLLKGMQVWTVSSLWYDKFGERKKGRKFVPVSIINVSPGNMVFPLKLDILDERGEASVLYMNLKDAGIESRTFPKLFSLTDPKERYPQILPEVWELIQNGRLRTGMTKTECKLALGNPSDVNSGHDWNSTIEFWSYPNGTFLRFEDGLLVSFRD